MNEENIYIHNVAKAATPGCGWQSVVSAELVLLARILVRDGMSDVSTEPSPINNRPFFRPCPASRSISVKRGNHRTRVGVVDLLELFAVRLPLYAGSIVDPLLFKQFSRIQDLCLPSIIECL